MSSKQRQPQLFMSVVDFYGPVNFLGDVDFLAGVSSLGVPVVLSGEGAEENLPQLPLSPPVVVSTPLGLVIADSSNLSHAGRVMGVLVGNLIITHGEIVSEGFSFTKGDVLYLSEAGTVTPILPTTGFQQRLGVATATDTMNVTLGDPIVLEGI